MTDDRSEFTVAREAGLRQRHEQRLARAADDALFAALIDDLEYGNIPGSKLQLNDRTVWLHSKAWLLECQKARREP